MTVNALRALVGIVTAVAWLLAASMSASAHHSLSAEFDTEQPMVTLTGTITEMRWTNPHGWLYIDVKDNKGQAKSWAIEFASPNQLYRRGWAREDLPVGKTVTVTGWASRDKSARISATDVTLPDGRALFAGAAPSEGK